jgi:hypothetical protein
MTNCSDKKIKKLRCTLLSINHFVDLSNDIIDDIYHK